MSERCACCHVISTTTDGLCAACHDAVRGIDGLTEAMRAHVLAHALVRSGRDIARRMDTTHTAHGSSMGNAVRASGLSREQLVRTARYGMLRSVWEKPLGFEDVRIPGDVSAQKSGEVTVSHRDPEPRREAKPTNKAASKAPKKTAPEPIVGDAVVAMCHKRLAGVSVEELAEEYGVKAATIEIVTRHAVPEEPASIEHTTEEDPAVPLPMPTHTPAPSETIDAPAPEPGDARAPKPEELIKAREHVERMEAAYRAEFALLALPTLASGILAPTWGLLRAACEYERAKCGFEVLASMAEES